MNNPLKIEIPSILQPTPRPVPRVWGGNRLRSFRNLSGAPGVPLGESWEIFDRGEGCSVDFSLQGERYALSELLEMDPGKILGNASLDSLGRFPLMVKILDAAQNLSLQLHPGRKEGFDRGFGDQGKDEVWVVLEAKPGAEVMIGFRDGVSPESFFEALKREEDPTPLLRRLEAKPGDVFIIPAGTVHSLGSGLLIYELQENSDLTFRVHDWGRLGLDGKLRKLHLNEARNTQFSPPCDPRICPTSLGRGLSKLVETEGFRLFRWELAGEEDLLGEGSFAILSVIEGEVEAHWDHGEVHFAEGESGLLLGELPKVHLIPNGTCTILLSRPGTQWS